ncbi:MAG: hypothetical protein VX392_01760 [Verrucomicrobiota bacterium]|nr:hypothetical protein [Verrucomicrobiota bacterium]
MSLNKAPDDTGQPAFTSQLKHRGTLILTMGILGWLCCSYFTAIPAWVMGKEDIRLIEAGKMEQEGKGITKAGMILGMLSTIVSTITIVIWALVEIL